MTYISLFSDLTHISNSILWIYIILGLMVWADTMREVILIVGFHGTVTLANIPNYVHVSWICIILGFMSWAIPVSDLILI